MDTQSTAVTNFKIVKKLFIFFIFLSISLPFSGLEAKTLESLEFDSRWPDASAGNLASSQSCDTLYFASGNVLSLINADTFTERSRLVFETDKGITGIAFSPSSNTVFAACGGNGLKAVNVSNPSAPAVVGELRVDQNKNVVHCTAIDYFDNRIYIADAFFGMRIIDVSNPANPNQSGSFEQVSEYINPEESDQTASGGHINIKIRCINSIKYAFVLDQYYGLRIFDVSSDSDPHLLEQYDMRAQEYYGQLSPVVDLDVDDRYVYVTDAQHGVTIIDIFSDEANPSRINISKIGQLETPGSASGISLSDKTVYIADGNSGLFVADVSDKANPVHVGTYATKGTYIASCCDGNLYIVDCMDGLVKLKSDGLSGYTKTLVYPPPSDIHALTCDYDYIYLLDNAGPLEGMRILNTSETGEYCLQSFMPTPGNASGIALSGSKAYIADGTEGITIVDIQDKKNPAPAGSFRTSGNARDILVYNNPDASATCYISDSRSGLVIADIDDQGLLVEIGRIYIENAKACAVYEILDKEDENNDANDTEEENIHRYILVVNGKELLIVDVADPSSPAVVSSFETPGESLDVAVRDTYAVIADGSAGVLLVDLVDLHHPVLTAQFDTEGVAEGVEMLDSYIHTADGTNGVQILGIVDTQPVELTLITDYDTPGYTSDITVNYNPDHMCTYIGDGLGGFVSFLHSDRLSGGITEMPFTESPDDEGWDRADSAHCFISTLF